MLPTVTAAAALGDSRPTTPWPTHAQKAPQVSVHLQTHAHARAHTHNTRTVTCTHMGVAQTRHNVDTPRHMHTGLDRQAAGCVSRAVPQMSTREGEGVAQGCLGEGG